MSTEEPRGMSPLPYFALHGSPLFTCFQLPRVDEGLDFCSNAQFSTKVRKFGILFQHQLPVYLTFLVLRKKVLVFTN